MLVVAVAAVVSLIVFDKADTGVSDASPDTLLSGMALSLDGRYLYVATADPARLSVIDTVAGTATKAPVRWSG